MIGKVDLVMWAKNGENVLPTVLKRIDEVIPQENICYKILVDDHSTDRTTEINKFTRLKRENGEKIVVN
jgi:glycosyltransferase involved in cell wall biosynthesis